MSATKLYAELSRKVLLLNNEVFLGEFIQNDMTLLKLRALLICRACRELCLQPFGSDYCQHLTCKECLNARTVRQACKWCRNPDDLSLDFQSKILIASYRKLCAILRDFVTGHTINSPGLTKDVKEKLLQTLDEGCGYPRSEVTKVKNVQEIKKIRDSASEPQKVQKVSIAVQADAIPEPDEKSPVCPPCCCTCSEVKGDLINHEKSLDQDQKGEDIAAVVSEIKDEKKIECVLDYRSDTVSSTVPDTIPPATFSAPDEEAQNKYGAFVKDGGENSALVNESHVVDEIKVEPDLRLSDELPNVAPPKEEKTEGSSEYIGVLASTIPVKERENRSIFEKCGLALSPAKVESDTPKSKSSEKSRRKLKKSKEKKLKYTCEIKQKLQPLKLKVRKVNSDGYSVQYNISNTNEKTEVNTFTIHKSEDCKGSDDYVTSDNLTGSDTQESETRKQKRKASLGGKYAEFSDDSDFESDSYISKVHPKVVMKKDKAEACSCGSGSHVKYFTNICKRQRCPCFSQGKSCNACKCRFCSNPYAGKTETDDMFTDSDSENEKPQLTYWLKEENEVVDVETM